jgi:type 1 glutamine amidotransferase
MAPSARRLSLALALAAAASPAPAAPAAEKIGVLIIDGQNNHDWRKTTPVLQEMLVKTGRFSVEVMTTPEQNALRDAWESFKPDFAKYGAVLSNYNGEEWPAGVKLAFEKYIEEGGGLVVYHAANNAFPAWGAWNRMIALGWRDKKFGARITVDDEGKTVRTRKGEGPDAGHGKQHAYECIIRDKEHPVTKGMPEKWKHATDELYHAQRGPAEDMTLLVTAFSDKSTGGTGAHEPMVFTVDYGKGRVFVNLLGHDPTSVAAPACAELMIRGTEWAATGQVSLPAEKPK